MTAPLLDICDLAISFGGLRAVHQFNLQMEPGSLHGLIGPNGAGKTTCFNLITGVYQPDTGTMQLNGKRLNSRSPDRIAKAGIARTFQNIRLFPNLTVLDNVRVACHLRTRHRLWGSLFRTRGHVGEERAITSHARQLLERINLDHRRDDFARNLPYGDQRRLEIVRALATSPRVLLLDEPAAGMNPAEKQALAQFIREIRQEFNLTLLLIEHDMGLVMDVCETITVLDHGQIIAVGTPCEIQRNPRVIEAYLGEPADSTSLEDA